MSKPGSIAKAMPPPAAYKKGGGGKAKGEPDEDDGDATAMESAAADLLAAIKKGDAGALAKALRECVAYC